MNQLVTVAVASLAMSLVPAGVLAQDAAAAAPAAAPAWSLGGGVTFGSLGFVRTRSTSTTPIALLGPTLAVPGATGTLERRLSERSWMLLRVSGSVQRERADVPAGSSGYTRDDDRQLTASVGVRHALTGRRAPVEVSTVVGVHGGYDDAERRVTTSGGFARESETTAFAGASFGIALQRELTDGLALRLSTPLLFATYSEGTQRTAGQPKSTSTGLTAAMTIAPQLELVAFF